jgi:hypothetical protein
LAVRNGLKQVLFRRRRHRSGTTESKQPYEGRGYVYLGRLLIWLQGMGSKEFCIDVSAISSSLQEGGLNRSPTAPVQRMLVYLVYLVYLVCLVDRTGNPSRRTRQTRKTCQPDRRARARCTSTGDRSGYSHSSSRLLTNYLSTRNCEHLDTHRLHSRFFAGCSERPAFSPAQPWRTEMRLDPSKAAVSN